MSVVINGDFLCRNLTGIERFAFETCASLDLLIQKGSVKLLVPKNAKLVPDYKNIEIVHSKKKCTVFPLWLHITFSKYAKKNHLTTLDFANATPLFYPGIVFIHDIYAKVFSKDFSTFKDKLRRIYMCAMYRHAVYHAKKIITVSNFSKNEIASVYHINKEKITVIYNGWEHMKRIIADERIFSCFPILLEKPFYFTLGSLQKRKNLKWIVEYAKFHPKEFFAVSGKAISGMISEDIKDLKTLPNVILLGYVSDEQVKALMEKCKAFIFPSYYEGFGIPPLEALVCGAKIIISSSACLPELYGNTALYIDPKTTNVELSELIKLPVSEPTQILEKYTYQNAAKNLLNIIKEY